LGYKSKAEVSVQIVERWIMMRLRKLQLFSLAEANQAIRGLLDDLNNRPFKQRPGSRQSQFDAIDKPALKPLPDAPYAYRHVVKARAHIDYHVSYDGHHYSVPYRLRGEQVMVHAGEQTVAVFYQGKCVAEHPRSRNAISPRQTSRVDAESVLKLGAEYWPSYRARSALSTGKPTAPRARLSGVFRYLKPRQEVRQSTFGSGVYPS